MKRAIAISLVLILMLTGCSYTYEPQRVTGEVIEKEYKEPYKTIRMQPAGKTLIPITQHHSEQYIVKVSYNGIQGSKDDKELYDKVDVGDSIEVDYVKVYNRKGIIKKTYIDIK